jgi:hypothetical protein
MILFSVHPIRKARMLAVMQIAVAGICRFDLGQRMISVV